MTKVVNGIEVTITHQELDNLAAEYEQRLRDQGQLKEGMAPFSKYDFIAGVLAGGKFVLGQNSLGQENFKYDPR